MSEKEFKKVHPLRVWRVSKGLTQLDLARKLGYVTAGIVQNIEAGRLDPKASEVAKLCQYSNYGLTLWDFVNQEGPKND